MHNLPPSHPGDSFVRTNLDQHGNARRIWLLLTVLGLAATGIIVGTIILLPLHSKPIQPVVVHLTPTATYLPTYTLAPVPPTATATATATPDLSQAYPQPGWAIAGPHNATAVAFAPNNPTVGYACGPTVAIPYVSAQLSQSSSGGEDFSFAVRSAQGWGKWTSLNISAATCSLQVDPTNPQDVALLLNHCDLCLPGGASDLYRTEDGGAHWIQQIVPVDPKDPQGFSGFQDVFWAGDTLFADRFTAMGADQQMTHFILASRHGQALTWVDDALGLNWTHLGSVQATVNTTCYVDVWLPAANQGISSFLHYQSADGGLHWTPTRQFTTGADPIDLTLSSPDGHALIGSVTYPGTGGVYPSPHYYRSLNGGQTWQPFPSTIGDRQSFFLAPDGTLLYVELNANAHQVFRWDPGASAVTALGQPFPGQVTLSALEVDSRGHPVAIWAGHRGVGGLIASGLQQFVLK